jgi:hypothetical protein
MAARQCWNKALRPAVPCSCPCWTVQEGTRFPTAPPPLLSAGAGVGPLDHIRKSDSVSHSGLEDGV